MGTMENPTSSQNRNNCRKEVGSSGILVAVTNAADGLDKPSGGAKGFTDSNDVGIDGAAR